MNIFTKLSFLSVFCLAGTSAYAENYARVTKVEPYYVQQTISEYDTVCENVNVPVYKSVRGADGGDVLTGMVVGGLIGKGITGNDDGAAIGAVIGGISAGEKKRNVQVGTRVERQCYETIVQRNVNVVSYYVITYSWNNGVYRAETNNSYNVGDRIRVTPTPNL